MKNPEYDMPNIKFKLHKCLYFMILQKYLSEGFHADESHRSGAIVSCWLHTNVSTVPSQ